MPDPIEELSAEQALRILKRLVGKGGAIRDAVVAEATSLSREVDPDETSEDVFAALDAIDVQDLWDRSGRSADGYTSPDEAAAEIVEEELQPFFDECEGYHKLDLPGSEAAYCKGVILGIYRFVRESKSEFRQWSVDVPDECAGSLLDAWRDRNEDTVRVDAMRDFLHGRCPEWADWLQEDKGE